MGRVAWESTFLCLFSQWDEVFTTVTFRSFFCRFNRCWLTSGELFKWCCSFLQNNKLTLHRKVCSQDFPTDELSFHMPPQKSVRTLLFPISKFPHKPEIILFKPYLQCLLWHWINAHELKTARYLQKSAKTSYRLEPAQHGKHDVPSFRML